MVAEENRSLVLGIVERKRGQDLTFRIHVGDSIHFDFYRVDNCRRVKAVYQGTVMEFGGIKRKLFKNAYTISLGGIVLTIHEAGGTYRAHISAPLRMGISRELIGFNEDLDVA